MKYVNLPVILTAGFEYFYIINNIQGFLDIHSKQCSYSPGTGIASIIKSETQKYRMLTIVNVVMGSWFHQNHTGFMEWAAQYDTAGMEMRSRVLHEEWMKILSCRLVIFEQPLSVEIMAAQIAVYLK